MSRVVNFISGDSTDLASSIGGWSIVDGSGTLSISATKPDGAFITSLLVTPSTTDDLSIKLSGISVPSAYLGWTLSSYVRAWATYDTRVEITQVVKNAVGAQLSSTSQVVNIRGQKWSLVKVVEPSVSAQVGQNSFVDITVKFSDRDSMTVLTSPEVRITHPVTCTPNAIFDNTCVNEVYARLPLYLTEADETQDNPDFPLNRFMDVVFMELGDIYDLWETIRYVAPEDTTEEKKSTLVDPLTADVTWLPWLAMILGISLSNFTTGFSSWAGLEAAVDSSTYAGNDDGIPQWSEWETSPDTGDVGSDVSWDEIETFAPDTVDYESDLRWQVNTAYYGINAGTKNALVYATQKVLTGTKTVTVESIADGDPWKIRVKTLTAETPDADSPGDTSATVLAVIEPTIAAGFEVVHETI